MSDDLSIQGSLSETTVPDLFRSIIRSSETAVLSLEAIGRNDTIYFQEGRIVYAASSDSDMGLAETLLRLGELDIQQYDTAMEKLLVPRRIGALLCELGYLRADDLIRAAERQAAAIVQNAMAYRAGNYTMDFASQLPEGVVSLQLSTERLILDGVRRIDYWSLITRGIGRLGRMLEQVPGADMRLFQIELNDEENHVMSLFAEEPQSIEQVCARSYLSNFHTCRTIWGLLAVNLIQEAEDAVLVAEKRVAVESEYELEGLVERYNTLYQAIFALVFQRIGDHVYDFMDRVVRHLSPEAFPYLSGMNLEVNEGRVDIEQLLTNLYASGSKDQNAIVQTALDELLYGWIFEIRTEFGAEMEAEVVRLAESLKS